MRKEIIIQFDVEGFHNYPNAPKDVNFLSFPHRHTFVIKCGIIVTGLNREKEIFLCRDSVKQYLNSNYGTPCLFDSMSCEMIALDILEQFKNEGFNWVEVWEENTGGAKIIL